MTGKLFHWLLFVLCAVGLSAQTTGSLAGTAQDPSASSVANCLVKVTETGSGAERRVTTDGQGHYLLPGLSPGSYRVEASHAGFRTTVREDVELTAGRTVRVDFQLEIGELKESVVVEAEPPLLSTTAADWGGSIQRQKLESLPLKGRDMFDLVAQYPGASVQVGTEGSIFRGFGTFISVNGTRPWQNSYRMDGVYINEGSGSAPSSAGGRLLGIEGLAEVHLVTTPFSAEYGRTAGGVFTAVSRSGNNDWHGSAYEFLRNSAMDARNYFDSPTGPKAPLRKNQFGGLLSGPLSRNRLFFLANFEGIRETTSLTASPLTISEDGRRGVLSPGAQPIAINPAVRPFLDLFPLPSGRIFANGTGEYVTTVGKSVRENYVSGKTDWILSERWRTAGRYTFDAGTLGAMDDFELWDLSSRSRYHLVHTDTQFVQSPTTIFHFRVGFSRVWNSQEAIPLAEGARTLSFLPGRSLGQLRTTGLAIVGSSSLPGVGSILTRPRRHTLNNYQINEDQTLIRGAHTFKLGAGYDRVQFNQIADVAANGGYRFNSLRDFLQAAARAGDYMVPGSDTNRGFRQHQFHFYAQDEWRAAPRLSVTLGVRYETYSVPTEVNGKIATFRDPWSDPEVTLGGSLFENPSRKNFAPRAAIAWDMFGGGKTVLRAGGGIFFDLISSRDVLVAGNRMPPFFRRAAPANPPFPNLLAAPPGTVTITPDTLEYYMKQPYTAQFQLRLQQQVGLNTVVEVGYLGTRGVHLLSHLVNINTARPEVLADGRLYFAPTAPRMNPAFGQIATRRPHFDSNYHAFIVSLQRRFRQGLQFQLKYVWAKSIDNNSTSITQSDFLANDGVPTVFNYRANRGLSDFDLRHDFAANFSWQIPGPSGGVARAVLGGWEISGLFNARSGQPFTPGIGFDRANLRSSSSDQGQRPDALGVPADQVILGRVERWFDPMAFSLPAAGFLGNLGRNTLIGPGLVSMDGALQKHLWRTDRHSLRLRLEMYNFANHPNFRIPDSTDLDLWADPNTRLPAVGRITSTATPSRQIQLGIRFAF